MTVEELRELLEAANPDAEIRFAHDPAWPMEYRLSRRVVTLNDDQDPDEGGIVYLAEDEQLGYLPSQIVKELGWGNSD